MVGGKEDVWGRKKARKEGKKENVMELVSRSIRP